SELEPSALDSPPDPFWLGAGNTGTSRNASSSARGSWPAKIGLLSGEPKLAANATAWIAGPLANPFEKTASHAVRRDGPMLTFRPGPAASIPNTTSRPSSWDGFPIRPASAKDRLEIRPTSTTAACGLGPLANAISRHDAAISAAGAVLGLSSTLRSAVVT